MAWASFTFYLAGIGCLLAILIIQIVAVGKAAQWWGDIQ